MNTSIPTETSADRIDALLPQTQCTRCGYPTCRAYAEAIARNEADIDQCPPGGADGVVALAELLGRAAKPLNPVYGAEAPPLVAVIDEDVCIGCTKCIKACPVDAIVGAAKRMHTVLSAECTGCELCLPPCPVDCIAMVPAAAQPLSRNAVLERAMHARERFDARNARLVGHGQKIDAVGATLLPSPAAMDDVSAPAASSDATQPAPALPGAPPIKRSAVLEAIARGKARRAALKDSSSQ